MMIESASQKSVTTRKFPYEIEHMETYEAAELSPTLNSAQHQDFESVNNILEQVEGEAIQYLSTGLLGMLAQDTGKLGSVVAIWKVRQARDTAWTNGEILWQIKGLDLAREKFATVLDKWTGYAGRGLLIVE